MGSKVKMAPAKKGPMKMKDEKPTYKKGGSMKKGNC